MESIRFSEVTHDQYRNIHICFMEKDGYQIELVSPADTESVTAFYLLTGNGWLILYPAVASLTAYISMRVMTGTEDKKKRSLAVRTG